MRTTAEENAAIGRWIVERINRMDGPVRFLLPLHGVSAIDAPGKPFHDPAADAALFAAIRDGWKPRPTAGSSRSTPTSTTRPSPRPRSTPSATSPEDSRMARAYACIILKAPVETVWTIVRDFNGLPKWAPAIAKSKIEGGLDADVVGCVRSFHTHDGGHVRERLLMLDDARRCFTYNFEKPAFPVRNYVATLRLYPVTHTDQTFAEWEAHLRRGAGRRGQVREARLQRCLRREPQEPRGHHREDEAGEARGCGALEGLPAQQGVDVARHQGAGRRGVEDHARLRRHGRLA